jgi:hypothetical protein
MQQTWKLTQGVRVLPADTRSQRSCDGLDEHLYLKPGLGWDVGRDDLGGVAGAASCMRSPNSQYALHLAHALAMRALS